MKCTAFVLGSLLTFGSALPCAAQRTQSRFVSAQPASFERQDERTGGSAFLIEAAGGIAGSLAGFALVYSTSGSCESEDLVCNLQHAGAAIAAGTVGAAGGTYIAGRLAHTQPSAVGAFLGAVVGAAAGIGVWHLATEELDVVKSDAGAIITYGVTQGVVAALGSRIGRALR
jgi:hypothetical protein